ncbi:MAG: hypothetical protein JWP40_1952, partial [Blastococcus sp.]|nr:hypothetical protein [Blastococcus sp.]
LRRQRAEEEGTPLFFAIARAALRHAEGTASA